jgi:hypothetical protein
VSGPTGRWGWIALGAVASCGGGQPVAALPPPAWPSAADAVLAVTSAAASAPTDEANEVVAEMLGRVAETHELAVVRPVRSRRVTRSEGIELIRKKTEQDVPHAVIEAQGEMLRALELVPLDYDLVEGMYALLAGNVAGFYDPDADVMYLLDDLDLGSQQDTLAHELAHALQDQHYDLGARLTYRPGATDRLAATSTLAEGDAMSTMFEVLYGGADLLDARHLRFFMVASVALSESGATTPRALQASLVAPYFDGFALVQALRDRGDWQEVARAWRSPPATTEQVLHLDKYDAGEPALPVPSLPEPEGDGWRTLDSDTAGEQALRIVLEQWTTVAGAAEAAAGWGGDRYRVLQRGAGPQTEHALGWLIRFDTAADAAEAVAVVRSRFPETCQDRPALGPLARKQVGDAVCIVAGPYRRLTSGQTGTSPAGGCHGALRWLDAVLASR